MPIHIMRIKLLCNARNISCPTEIPGELPNIAEWQHELGGRKSMSLGYRHTKNPQSYGVSIPQAHVLFLLMAHIRPVLEYDSCLWNTKFVGDLRKLERVQRRWTKHIEGLRDLSYEERLGELGLYSVQGRLTRADLIQY